MILRDATELYETSSYWRFPFKELNPIQSTIYDHRKDNANFIISAATSAGKTIVAEILMDHAVKEERRCIFLSPLKAVTQEKYEDWTNNEHRWVRRNLSILTGDYALTSSRIEELNNSHIVLMTTEMLLSRCRNIESEKSDWLKEIDTLVIDESHLITVDGRGDLAEMGVVSFAKLNPDSRIVFLSATMDNTKEIAEWLTSLNNKETHILESNYRPAKLNVEFVPYQQIDWKQKNKRLFEVVCDLVEKYNDKFLVFFHSKKQISEFYEYAHKPDMAVYTADVSKEERENIIKEFKKKEGNIRVVIATNALAWGVNLPARRVIIADVRFGMEFVKPYDIKQMIGRAGRIGWDDQGDAYIIAPSDLGSISFEGIKEKYSGSNYIKSTINESLFTFHLTAEINLGNIKNYADAEQILKKTLFYKQGGYLNINTTLNELIEFEAIEVENAEYKIKNIGRIASWLFFYPQDIFYLRNNLLKLAEKDIDNDYKVCYTIGSIYTLDNPMNSEQKKEANEYINENRVMSRTPSRIFAYHLMLTNKYSLPYNSLVLSLRNDLDRVEMVMIMLNKMFAMNKKTIIKKMFLRLKYGISSEMTDLATIKGLGGTRLKRLEYEGITSMDQLESLTKLQIKKIFNSEKIYNNIMEEINATI
jgi:replicative superfamily II helicase